MPVTEHGVCNHAWESMSVRHYCRLRAGHPPGEWHLCPCGIFDHLPGAPSAGAPGTAAARLARPGSTQARFVRGVPGDF
jgi:hypothetical protein